jgi:hypothetical protein
LVRWPELDSSSVTAFLLPNPMPGAPTPTDEQPVAGWTRLLRRKPTLTRRHLAGDAGVGQRRTQRWRVRRARQTAAGLGAQAFLLDAAADALQAGGAEAVKAGFDQGHGKGL